MKVKYVIWLCVCVGVYPSYVHRLYASIHCSPMGPITHKPLYIGLRGADGCFFDWPEMVIKGLNICPLHASNPRQPLV